MRGLGYSLLGLGCAVLLPIAAAQARPYIPPSEAQVLAVIPAGGAHVSVASADLVRARADVALPLAQFYISRSRESGDLRNLGYAERALTPWLTRGSPVQATALVLHATILQSRHAFAPALAELDQALILQPDNVQAWLTRATVLRVVGRYPEALTACAHLSGATDPAVPELCEQSIRALTGHLEEAYAAVEVLGDGSLPPEVRAWRCSELGEMAERLDDDAAAERWLRAGLALAPQDFYMRTALADLLIRQHRAAETLAVLRGYESMEPLLLRVVIARQMLGGTDASASRTLLASAFAMEETRGEAVHLREQARFLLDVQHRPQAALAVALANWQVQREPDDLLILLRAAHDADQVQEAAVGRRFVVQERLQDARLAPYLAAGAT